jgi:D-alanine-D-alanine ligase-like ATP-grasp enzyme
MRQQLLMPLLVSAARKLNLDILVEPSRGMYGVLKFQNNRKYYLKDINLNINSANSASLAKNKAATSFFLREFGYNVPDFTIIRHEKHCLKQFIDDTCLNGYNYAQNIGFPVILKPNDMSQGRLIFKAHDEKEYFDAASEIVGQCNFGLVQKFYPGNDYRVVVLGDKILSVYRRVPFNVEGNSLSNIANLILQKQQLFSLSGRDTQISTDDPRISSKLRNQGLSLDSVPRLGEIVFLQDISNLSVGGETIELTAEIHESYAKLAINIARDMNLALCGIDIITNDITKVDNGSYIILEVNSSPGLDNYAFEGKMQEEYVENLYLKVLLYIQEHYS